MLSLLPVERNNHEMNENEKHSLNHAAPAVTAAGGGGVGSLGSGSSGSSAAGLSPAAVAAAVQAAESAAILEASANEVTIHTNTNEDSSNGSSQMLQDESSKVQNLKIFRPYLGCPRFFFQSRWREAYSFIGIHIRAIPNFCKNRKKSSSNDVSIKVLSSFFKN